MASTANKTQQPVAAKQPIDAAVNKTAAPSTTVKPVEQLKPATAAKVDPKAAISKTAPAKPAGSSAAQATQPKPTAPVKAPEVKTFAQQMADLEKELAEETLAEQKAKAGCADIMKKNSDFLLGDDLNLDDEIFSLMNELNEVKDKIQPRMRPLLSWKRELETKKVLQEDVLKKITDENVKMEKAFMPAPKKGDKVAAQPVRGPYYDHSKVLAEKLRTSKDKSLQLEEKRKGLVLLNRMLEETKKELTTAKNQQKAEQQTITALKTQKTNDEKKLQASQTEFEEKQIKFLKDLMSLEARIDAQAGHPQKILAESGKILQQAYRQKVSVHSVPLLVEDLKIVKSVPLAQRVQDQSDIISMSMRSSRMMKPVAQTVPGQPAPLPRTSSPSVSQTVIQQQLSKEDSMSALESGAITIENVPMDGDNLITEPQLIEESIEEEGEEPQMEEENDTEEGLYEDEDQEEEGEAENISVEVEEAENEYGEEDEVIEEEEEEEAEEVEEPQKMTLSNIMGQAMRQKVEGNIPTEKLKIFSTIQLVTELETIKARERTLLTKVESQQYLEREMKNELEELQTKLTDVLDLARNQVTKLQTAQDTYQEGILEAGIEDDEIIEALVKLQENLDLYKEIIRDPEGHIQSVVAQMEDEGELPEDDDRIHKVVKRTLATRYLSSEEQELEAEKVAREEHEDEALESDKQWGKLQVLMATVIALVLLIITMKVVKPSDEEEF